MGRSSDAFTENVDVMPTILEWLGVPVPPACDGESLLGFCRGEAPRDWRQEAHFAIDFRNHRDREGKRILGLAPEQCGIHRSAGYALQVRALHGAGTIAVRPGA